MTPTKILIGQTLVVFAVIVAGAQLAIKYVADAFDHVPALGAPCFSLAGDSLYYPWRFFEGGTLFKPMRRTSSCKSAASRSLAAWWAPRP